MTYLSIALSCVTIVAIVWMFSTKDRRRKLILLYVAVAATTGDLLINGRPWDYWVAAFSATMMALGLLAWAVGWARERRRRTRAITRDLT